MENNPVIHSKKNSKNNPQFSITIKLHERMIEIKQQSKSE